MVNKITVIGGGHVGESCSLLASQQELAKEVLLLDIIEGMPIGKGLDQWEAAPVLGFDTRVRGTNDWADAAGTDIFILTAGVARKPGMDREELLSINAGIVKSCAENIKEQAPDSIIIVVSNPLDVMAYVAMENSGFPRERVFGMAGILDTARFRSFLALELDVSVEDIQALVLGGHGDSMVPLVSYASVSGIPLTFFLDQEKLDPIITRTRKGGGEIVGYLKTGSAYYAPAAGAVQMAEAIVKDKKRILPCSCFLKGEYGQEGIFIGVPCKLGKAGMEGILEVPLSDDEAEALNNSVTAVRNTMADLEKLDY
jgi:malate dehydrogenase